jgi:DtxR family Mn-dependent transcriptional regulator
VTQRKSQRPEHARPGREAPTSEAIEDYAKAIHALAQGRQEPVGTTRLAERLGVTPATVTAMLKRLDSLGLVVHERYRGVTLTPAGERVALEVIRHHRLIESYLADVLGMPWDRVHSEAEVLEHYISEELEELIAAKLGHPRRDPHGDPIPGRDLAPLRADESVPLASLEPGDRVVFTRVSDSDPEMLRYLASRGIRPGATLSAVAHRPFGGGLEVDVDGETHLLGGALLEKVRCEPPPRSVSPGR